MLELELVVPAYNEEKNLKLLLEKTIKAACEHGYTFKQFQIIIVQNGSADNSQNVLKELQKSFVGSWLKVINIQENHGYGFGLWTGLKTTTARFVAWTHADMQCDPSDVFKALKILKSSQTSDKLIVKGMRYSRNWKDIFVSRVFELFVLLILRKRIYEINAQPKVFKRDLINLLDNPPFNFGFDLYVLYVARLNNYKFIELPVLFPPRVHGNSSWSFSFFKRYRTILSIILYMFHLRNKTNSYF